MTKKKGFFAKALDIIERVGNKLPDPFVLFVILAIFMIFLSYISSVPGASVSHPGTGAEPPIQSLRSGDALPFIRTSMLASFTASAPIGLVPAMMPGIRLAATLGLLNYAIRKTILT